MFLFIPKVSLAIFNEFRINVKITIDRQSHLRYYNIIYIHYIYIHTYTYIIYIRLELNRGVLN